MAELTAPKENVNAISTKPKGRQTSSMASTTASATGVNAIRQAGAFADAVNRLRSDAQPRTAAMGSQPTITLAQVAERRKAAAKKSEKKHG